VCSVTGLVGSGGKAACVAGADRVICCEAGMREEYVIVDGLPACRRSHTMERRTSKCSTVCSIISKINFSHWKPPGVSERMWSVNLDGSISGECQTPGGHSGRPWE